MRANKIRSAVLMMAAFAGVSFAAANAHATGDVGTGTSTASGGPNSSTGSATLHYEDGKGLDTTIQTGFVGPSIVQANVGIKIDPVTNGGPLYIVDMPKGANVEANWGSDKKIILKPQTGASTDGLVTVRHTLTPSIDLKLSVFGLNASFSYDADKLINMIPGAQFNYDSKATQAFAPWGFNAVATKLTAPDLSNAQLFSMDMSQLPDFVSDNITGQFGVRAVTEPTFSYKTTQISISGADGAIADANGQVIIDAADGDYLEVMTAVEGTMDVAGGLSVQPFVHLDSVAGQNLNTDVAYDVYTKDFTTPTQTVDFQTVLVHIPMPNVHVPTSGVNLGDVSNTVTKKVTIQNSGEKDATMTFKSSNSAFSVPGGQISIGAKGTYDLEVQFTPGGQGAAEADITVASNDADSPVQTFKIGANGADVSGPDDGSGATDKNGPKSSDGCGCKAAGHSSTPGWAGFGLLALGAIVFVRRRRSA